MCKYFFFVPFSAPKANKANKSMAAPVNKSLQHGCVQREESQQEWGNQALMSYSTLGYSLRSYYHKMMHVSVMRI